VLLADDRAPPARVPQPHEYVWSLWKDGHRKDCGLYFHGETYGREVQLVDDGFIEFRRRFTFKEAGCGLRESCVAIWNLTGRPQVEMAHLVIVLPLAENPNPIRKPVEPAADLTDDHTLRRADDSIALAVRLHRLNPVVVLLRFFRLVIRTRKTVVAPSGFSLIGDSAVSTRRSGSVP
jgi:hypothetical protein